MAATGARNSSGASAETAGARRRVLRGWMVDDDEEYRMAFAQLANVERGIRITRQFSSLKPLLAALAEERPPDIVLLDLNIGEENGLSGIRPAKKLAPNVKVLMLTTFNNTRAEAEAFDSGAGGFLLKLYDPDEIFRLIQQCFYEPDDPRLFPNLSRGDARVASMNARIILEDKSAEPAGFFATLRQLYRRRQTS